MTLTGVGASSVVIGALGWRVGGVWWDQPAYGGMKVLSLQEVQVVNSIAEALFPGEPARAGGLPSGIQAGCTEFFDDFLSSSLEPVTANAMRLLVHMIDEMAIGSGGQRFHKSSLARRVEHLKAWQSSRFALRRGAFSALKIFLAMGYCENPEVLAAAGIDFTCGDWA